MNNSIIEKNYNIKILELLTEKDSYKIRTSNTNYDLVKVTKYELSLLLLNINDRSRYRIKKTIKGSYYTYINGNYYILIELDNRSNISLYEVINELKAIDNQSPIDIVNKWQIKNDYLEEYLKNSNNELVIETKDYYLGLAEQAIVIYKDSSNIYNEKVLCHKRIRKDNYRMPNNIVIDYKERDIAEYIKYLIFIECLDENEIIKIIDKNIINHYNLNLIISRLLYPSEYFDLIDESRGGVDINNKIINLINKEKLRQKIIFYINKKRVKTL